MSFAIRQFSPFAASFLLHFGVFGLVGLVAMKPAILAPFGVYKKGGPVIVEIETSSSFKVTSLVKSIARPLLAENSDVAIQKKKLVTSSQSIAPVDQAKNQLGHADGTASSGLLGDANGKQASIKERYLYELHVLITGRKIYPVTSRRLRESGKVLVQFTVERDGSFRNISVKEGTRFSRLNEAAQELVSGIGKYKPLPQEFTGPEAKFEVPIEYTLN